MWSTSGLTNSATIPFKKDGTVVYEAEVKTADGKEVDIVVAADGTLIKIESDDEEDDDKK